MYSNKLLLMLVGYAFAVGADASALPPLDHVVAITSFRTPNQPGKPALPTQSYGTGFVYQGRFVATSYHVIQQSQQIRVRTLDQRVWNANLIGFDEKTDIALLQVQDKSFGRRHLGLPLAPSPRVATPVMALGNSYGQGIHVTLGKVNAVDHVVEKNGIPTPFIRATAPGTLGFSGGPLVSGKDVVGIITDISVSPNVFTYAIDAGTAQPLVDQWIKQGAGAKLKSDAQAKDSPKCQERQKPKLVALVYRNKRNR